MLKLRFEWDLVKAEANRTKHGIAFEDAITAFDDPNALVADDAPHSSPSERRQWLIGAADIGVLVVVFTVRPPGEVYRLISARRANRRERNGYEEARRLSL
jgi:uncharacterized DUF497 family protein